MKDTLDNSAISKVLGQVVDYPDQYDPTILVRELRQNNRDHLGFDLDSLPFDGFDTWNAYEVSTLTPEGKPITGCLKIRYSCKSPYIVESKSIKLYLNSFNMFKGWSDTSPVSVVDELVDNVTKDLSKLLETDVVVGFISSKVMPGDPMFSNYILIDNVLFEDSEELIHYSETPKILQGCDRAMAGVVEWHSALLKSNCRVTRQPDWGDVFLYMKGGDIPSRRAFAEYLVSFRDECHFHEEICETMYTRLLETFNPSALVVTCLYARRGGIDINPCRFMPNTDSSSHVPFALGNTGIPHAKTLKQ
tara:strand:- start:8945 stop:9859 length:915 start_codon:yes stop_codon:yes gene_type:complete